jgi:hypothetical protein
MPYRPSQCILLEQLPLGQIVLRPCVQSGLGELMVILTGEDNDRNSGSRRTHRFHGGDSGRIGQGQVEQYHVGFADRGGSNPVGEC